MFHFAGNEAFWLNITNAGFGLIVLIMIMIIGFSIYREVFKHSHN
jgi:hypothetical protein